MMNKKELEQIEEMLEADDLFEEDEDMNEKKSIGDVAYNVGAKIGKVTTSTGFKVAKAIVKLAGVAAIATYAYKKGMDTGVQQACNDLDDYFDFTDDDVVEDEEFDEESKEEPTEE